MAEQTTEKSRRERRKESRLAKKTSKYQSWLQHQKSESIKKSTNQDPELEPESKLDQSVSPSLNETQVVKKLKSLSEKQVAAEEHALSEDETCDTVVRKVKKSSKTSSKKKRVELGVSEISFAAQKDLELERKLSKRLKVKEGKLGGLDDGLNLLFEGFPSGDDLFGDMEDLDTDELPKRKSKKSTLSKKQKLSKKGVEAKSLYGASGPVEAPDQDVAFEEVPDSETSRKKKNKKRKLANQEQEDVCIVKPVESCGTDATSGDVAAEVSEKKEKGKYIAPHLRARAGNEPEEHTQIRRRVRGLLNRISESNVESITGELSLIFQSVPRSVASQIMIEETLASCSGGPRGNKQYAAVFGAFVAGMACLVGMDFGAKFMASFAKCFEDEYHKQDNLSLRNIALLLSYLCIFGVCSSDLIFDFLIMLSKRLTEVDVSIILTVLQSCGMKIRADDPTAMKTFILNIQDTSNKMKASSGDVPEKNNSKRMEFMLETIYDIKNNKKKTEEVNPRIKKWLQKLRVDDISIRGLTWSKLLDPDKKGQWWLSGDVVSATDNVKNIEDVANKIDKDVAETQRMLQLAAAQRMNTDSRRAIFCIIMSGEDYIDAFEKLLRLELPGKQDRDIMRVLVECCLQEKVFNKYYTVLASKLCEHDKNHKFTLQFCLWDHFKELESMALSRSMHLAKFVAEMAASFTLSLTVLKTVDLSDITQLTPKRIMHFRILFEAIFDYPDTVVWKIFTRIAGTPELESFRQGIEFFIKEYILKTNKAVSQKFKLAKRALNNIEGVLMQE
ncbi:nucleolar MIF4G domain-containing protein 1 [Trifolium pratense]|uniref:nucleolar MIF4G domain-containing protein 1 n=1 Tax=Trifolium pratense TaxID=57577 RepID=UPI001E6947AA|nr:nucleolar MIF4G domain-containing protein 1 [Trifolium pratense]XP_045795621.1 nucleolar MIF4G domain-containing protein 1 [Trifolium pratense]XP_045795622.1 nucleolar MIF4G domain-containing protein 1 [Trifolium pratense]